MSEPLTLFARITPKPEHLAAARQAVLGILSATRAEPGCRAFTLHDDQGDGRAIQFCHSGLGVSGAELTQRLYGGDPPAL